MKSFIALIFCGLLFFAGAADAKEVRVSLRDLDMSTSQDVDRAYARLKIAVRKVCADEPVYGYRVRSRACERETLNAIITRANSDALMARHGRDAARSTLASAK